ncbi:MAG: 2-oxoadipate dioxygenase/decarboxylase family protein [Acidimicrobiales bacterium]
MTPVTGGSALHTLVASRLGDVRAGDLLAGLELHPDVLAPAGATVPRAVLAQALGMLLLDDLLARVPSAAAYVADRRAGGGTVFLDHGAVRTVEGVDCGALPSGQEGVTRVLSALGYAHRYTYGLTRLGMTGRSWCHLDLPAAVPQYFVSELHAERFSEPFREAAARVLSTSVDPVDDAAGADLARLAADGALPADRAAALLPVLAACFGRQHADPAVDDYEALLAESAEMAWIATEGTVFNHATDRVADVVSVAEAERVAGRPIKDQVEVSGTGRILQTAHRAAVVERTLRAADGSRVTRPVPGSFFEFITRRALPDGSGPDLAFDAANAQQIFAMTRSAGPEAAAP